MSEVIADAELYESDFFAWTQLQAKKLRQLHRIRSNVDLDLPRLAEEVGDLGKAERDAVRSQLRRIIEHSLKLEYSPSPLPIHGWQRSIMDARATLGDKLTKTLQRDLRANLQRLYGQARDQAESELRERGEDAAAASLPRTCPYSLDRLLQQGWFPQPARAGG